MRKYISVRMVTDLDGNQNVNIDVLKNVEDIRDYAFGGRGAVGYIDETDLEDLYTPARLMALNLAGSEDESLVEQLVEAFEEILTRRQIGVVVNY